MAEKCTTHTYDLSDVESEPLLCLVCGEALWEWSPGSQQDLDECVDAIAELMD